MDSVLCQCTQLVCIVQWHHTASKHLIILITYCIRNADTDFEIIFLLFEFLGRTITPKKEVIHSWSLTYMGIHFDLDTQQLSVHQEK